MTDHAAATETAAGHQHDPANIRKVAMWAFLGSEVLFFGSLITTFLLYRTPEVGPGPADIFDIPFTSISSFVLLMSSLTMVLAHHAADRTDWRQMRVWLTATAGLGLVFIAGQVYEFVEFVDHGLTWTTSPFGSAFYMLTGFHGAHVAVGVLMLLSAVLMSRAGKLSTNRGLNIELVALYWHFVDIVWIVIFTVVYLLQV
jgi:cytochrome c oxidase subunit 3/cytochrome o ubiquinol oxidase subunit 3